MKTQKTMRDIVTELIAKGYDVKFYNRTDGGILITEINGSKYSGAKGNEIARSIVGSQLSPLRRTQLQEIVPKTGKRIKKQQILSEQVLKELKKLQSLERRKGKTTTRKRHVEMHFQRYGEKDTLHSIHAKRQRAYGYAYESNVEWFIIRFKDIVDQLRYTGAFDYEIGNLKETDPSFKYFKILGYLEKHINTLPDDTLMKLYHVLYNMEMVGENISTFLDQMCHILNI